MPSNKLPPGSLVRLSSLHPYLCSASRGSQARSTTPADSSVSCAYCPHLLQVLITGANGFLGSHICDQLLLAGYRVRGTVRNTEKQAWLVEYFDKKHGKGKFELAHVPDFTADGCLDEAIKGCSAIAHTASDLSFSPDPNAIITPVIKATQRALEAAMKEPGIKSFVLTSSSTAATKANPDKKFHIDRNTWNEEEVKTAWAPPP